LPIFLRIGENALKGKEAEFVRFFEGKRFLYFSIFVGGKGHKITSEKKTPPTLYDRTFGDLDPPQGHIRGVI